MHCTNGIIMQKPTPYIAPVNRPALVEPTIANPYSLSKRRSFQHVITNQQGK